MDNSALKTGDTNCLDLDRLLVCLLEPVDHPPFALGQSHLGV